MLCVCVYVRHKMTNVKSAGPWTENRVITEKVRFEDEKNRCQVLFTFQALEQHRSLEFVKFLVVIPLCVSVCVGGSVQFRSADLWGHQMGK